MKKKNQIQINIRISVHWIQRQNSNEFFSRNICLYRGKNFVGLPTSETRTVYEEKKRSIKNEKKKPQAT